MPWTFAHPLAVVPFRRFRRLNFAALVIGSMSPDFGYYLRFPGAGTAHTILGTFTVCLPCGLFGVGLFYLLRRPLCFVLPQPHRAALTPPAVRPAAVSLPGFFIAALCVLLGAWTHIIWDSFTHRGGFAVEHLSVLRAPVVHVGGSTLPVSYVIQQTSTFIGGAILVILYFRWLRRQVTPAVAEPERFPDRWRYFLFGVLTAIAIAFAAPTALHSASPFDGYFGFRVFVFRLCVHSTAAFIALLILSSVTLYRIRRRG
jgi:hypothetical protein